MPSNACNILYTCNLISTNTASFRPSTNDRGSHIDPTSTKSAKSKHCYQTMDWNTTPDQRHEWHYANQKLRCDQIRRRPDDYVPFQSIFQPDGRHAYNPNGRQYPQQVIRGQGTPRDFSRMPNHNVYPRDTMRPMGVHYHMMQHGGGYGSGYGGGYGGYR
jgi:hypothetical protein